MKYNIDRQGDTFTISCPISVAFAGTAFYEKTFEYVFEGLPRGTMEAVSDTRFVFTAAPATGVSFDTLSRILGPALHGRTEQDLETAIGALQIENIRLRSQRSACEQDRGQDVRRGKVAGLSAARDFILQKAKVVRADIALHTEEGARGAQFLAQIHLDLLENIATELLEKINAAPR